MARPIDKNKDYQRIVSSNHRISDKTLLNIEAALKLIPYAGGFLATYFGEIRGKRAKERMKNFFDYFTRRLNELDESKIDKDYLNSEEFAELFMQGAEQAARSTTQRRIERFANILLNNALMGAQARSRTQSIMSFVDRISDLDAFILLGYGNPSLPSLRASNKEEAFSLIQKLANFVGVDCPPKDSVVESIIYMDNLGLTWVNERQVDEKQEKGKDLILKEFSSFRTPLGDALASVIAPPRFFKVHTNTAKKLVWPDDHLEEGYRGAGNSK